MEKKKTGRPRKLLYRIRTKFILCIFFLLVAMTLIVDFTVYRVYRRDVEEKEQSSMAGSIAELSRSIRSSVVSLEESMMYKITECGVFDYQSELGAASAYTVEKGIRNFAALMNTRDVEVRSVYVKDIYRCKFYIEKDSTSHENLKQYKNLKIYDYIEENTELLFSKRGTTVWRWFDDTPQDVYLIKSTVDQSTLQFKGILCVAIDISYFEELMKNMNYHMAVYDECGQLLYREADAGDVPIRYGQMKEQISDRQYICSETVVPRENWTAAGFIAREEAFGGIRVLLRTLLLIELLVFAIMGAVIFWISGGMTHNIAALSENFKRINEGKKARRISYRAHDETAYLCEQFNTMQDQLKRSAEQLALDSTLREKAEYNALLAQMNPHFLYNTLESISSMAKLQREDAIVESIQKLSRLLRVSISGEEQEVPLDREAEYIRQYLSLQNMMTGERLSWDIDMEPGAGEALVPKLILQPLVENAVIHGFEHVLEDPVIVIAARREDADLLIEVCDNGEGIDQELADRILEEEEPEEMKRDRAHIGIKSIQKRIQILYGKDYGLAMVSSPGSGMIVKIRLPYRKGGGPCTK